MNPPDWYASTDDFGVGRRGPLLAPLSTAAPLPYGRLRAPGATDRKITRVGFSGGERAQSGAVARRGGVSAVRFISRRGKFRNGMSYYQQNKQIWYAVHKVREHMRFRRRIMGRFATGVRQF